jgi:drug/metabolite transporter (DMT)-like permease
VAVLLAAGAALLFGALAVTIRTALRTSPDADAGALATSAVACLTCIAIAAAFGQWSRVPWRDTWPYFVVGIVVPGLSQLLFTRAVALIGASRTAILVGISPVLSAAIAISLLGEPFRVSLAVGTVLVVCGGTLLAWERGRPSGLLTFGAALGALAAALFSVRDNFVRWADRGSGVPGVVAAACSLTTAVLVLALVVAIEGDGLRRTRTASKPFLIPGALNGLAYAFLLTAFDRGRVTVVAPLYATESLWAVVFAVLILRGVERVGLRVLAAAVLVVMGGALIGGFR